MDDAPQIRIERGTPTAQEVAALVGVLLSLPPAEAATAAPAGSRWLERGRPGSAPRRGPDAWRASALPR
jgi:hypothetical protein